MPPAADLAPGRRRDRKKTETREALRRAAVRLALEHGYEQLTVEAITEAADVSVRTFFNYFSSKDEALLAPDVERAGELAAALALRPADEPPVLALRAVFLELADVLVAHQPLWQARMEVLRENPQLWPRMISGFHAFEGSLAAAVGQRTGRDPETDLYPGLVAASVVGALRVSLAHWRTTGSPQSLSDLLGSAFDLLGDGLVPPAPHPAPGGPA